MGFFDFFKTPDINQELIAFHNTKDGVLLDVRTPQEYKEGHIPGSKNVPLQSLSQAASDSFICLLPFRGKKQTGGCLVTGNEFYKCEKYRRHCFLYRKGGKIR